MTTTQMAYFLAMVEKLNFTAVAELFYVTQPTLSRQIMNLETELCLPLFVRKNNTVTVTAAGMALYDGLKPLYQQLTQLLDTVQHFDAQQKGSFTVGIPEELLLDDPVQLAIGVLSATHPELNVSIIRASYARIRQGLLDGSIQVADSITNGFDIDSGPFGFLKIADERVHLACSRTIGSTLPALLSKAQFHEILRHNKLFLGSFDDFGQRAQVPITVFRNAFGPFDFEPVIETNSSVLSITAQVASGLGVSICNRSNLFAIDNKTSIVELDVEPGVGTTYEKGLIYVENSLSPLLEHFLDLVRDNM